MTKLSDKWRMAARRDDMFKYINGGEASDLYQLVGEIDDLEAALRGLMEWRDLPEVRNETVVVANHGVRYTPEQIERLHGYWGRAQAVLDKVGTE